MRLVGGVSRSLLAFGGEARVLLSVGFDPSMSHTSCLSARLRYFFVRRIA